MVFFSGLFRRFRISRIYSCWSRFCGMRGNIASIPSGGGFRTWQVGRILSGFVLQRSVWSSRLLRSRVCSRVLSAEGLELELGCLLLIGRMRRLLRRLLFWRFLGIVVGGFRFLSYRFLGRFRICSRRWIFVGFRLSRLGLCTVLRLSKRDRTPRQEPRCRGLWLFFRWGL